MEVEIARREGLDTLSAYRQAMDSCRRAMLCRAVADTAALEHSARLSYGRLASDGGWGRSLVSQVFFYIPQNIPARALGRVEQRMDSIYQAVRQGADFETLVRHYSDDKARRWVCHLQMPVEWEDSVSVLPAGACSRPFFTPQGLHLVKVWQRESLPGYDTLRPLLVERLHHSAWAKSARASVEQLKQRYGYRPDKAGQEELRVKGKTSRTLFTLDGHDYTGDAFALFAKAYPAGQKRQEEAFLLRALLSCEERHLAEYHPDCDRQMQEWGDSLLWQLVADRYWGEQALADSALLQQYLDEHRAHFHWSQPRYRGILLQCRTKQVAKRARKLLKALPESEWPEAVRLMLNSGTQQVKVRQALFAPGDDPWVDGLVFRKEKPEPDADFPIALVVGRRQKGPETPEEAGEALREECRSFLRKRWRESHSPSGKVEINEEVLKTVN